jgi:hypothetical protein
MEVNDGNVFSCGLEVNNAGTLFMAILVFGAVFLAGVLFGWPVGLFVGFVILILIILLNK